MDAFRNIRADWNKRGFVFSHRQPRYCLKRNSKNALASPFIKSPNDPILARATDSLQQARASLAVRLVKHNGAPHTASVKNCEHGLCSERKPAVRPRECCILQEDPLTAPLDAFAPELL